MLMYKFSKDNHVTLLNIIKYQYITFFLFLNVKLKYVIDFIQYLLFVRNIDHIVNLDILIKV